MSSEKKVNYPQTIIKKSLGATDSETYLARLCDRTFLSLWSYPNLYRKQGQQKSTQQKNTGDGKELCDLLVVFENHVIILSDKLCKFPEGEDTQQNWKRWRSILG